MSRVDIENLRVLKAYSFVFNSGTTHQDGIYTVLDINSWSVSLEDCWGDKSHVTKGDINAAFEYELHSTVEEAPSLISEPPCMCSSYDLHAFGCRCDWITWRKSRE